MAELPGVYVVGNLGDIAVTGITSNDDTSTPFVDIIATATLTNADGTAYSGRVEDPVQGATLDHLRPFEKVRGGTVSAGVEVVDSDDSLPDGRYFITEFPLKFTSGDEATDALVPQNLWWKIVVEGVVRRNKKSGEVKESRILATYRFPLPNQDYSGSAYQLADDDGATIGPIGGVDCVNVLTLVDPVTSAPATDQFAAAMASRPDTINDAVTEARVNDLVDLSPAVTASGAYTDGRISAGDTGFAGEVRSVAPPLYTITGYTATLPAGETAVANYADIDAFEAAVTPTVAGQQAQIAGWPCAGMIALLVSVSDGAGTYEWEVM